MPRPDPHGPGPGQDSLLGDDDPAPVVLHPLERGPIEKGTADGLAAAARRGLHEDTDAGAAALVLGMARAADHADGQQAAYKLAKLGPAMIDLLDRLHMTPQARRELEPGGADTFGA